MGQASELDALRNAHPGWRIFRSDQGWWYATRRHHIPQHVHRARLGLWTTCDGATAADLAAELDAQEDRTRQAVVMFGESTLSNRAPGIPPTSAAVEEPAPMPSPDLAADNDAATHALRQLADELARYPLHTKIIKGGGRPAILRVTAQATADLKEDVACQPREQDSRYLWSWGEEIQGQTLPDKAATIAHVLCADHKHEVA